MSRMFDRILAQGFEAPWWADRSFDHEFRRMRDKLLQVLRSAQVFSIDNVCEYCYTSIEKEFWTLGDFPNLAPPFPSFFMEMQSPHQMLSHVDGRLQLAPTGYDFAGWGVLVIGAENARLDAIRRSLSIHRSTVFLSTAQHLPELAEPQSVSEADVPKWHLVAMLFVEERRGHIVAPVVIWEFDVDATGAASGHLDIGSVTRPRELPDALYHEWLSLWSSHLYPAFLSISFLHCKNVQVERQAPPRKLSRAFQRRHGRPLTQFHTLQITPMKQVLEREGQSGTLGLKKALHICRGHFKTFTPDRKLFGRHIGTYWWDAHVRGSMEQGMCVKDYQVNQPAASPRAVSPETSPAQ